MTSLIQIRNLCKVYTRNHWWQKRLGLLALDNVDLAIQSGQTVALVGGSGSGKTTLAMSLVGLERPDSGEIWFEGRNLLARGAGRKTRFEPEIQLVFQDSASALNPRMSATQIIEEPLLISRQGSSKERSHLALQMMDQVGLSPKWKDRLPHQFSGGQRQRLAIARALVLKPKLLILDEALTGLDLSIQGQIMNLLLDLQALEGLSYLYISHNLELAAHVADEIAVMYQGRIVECSSQSEFFSHVHHPHTQALLTSMPPRLVYGAHGGG
jgi:ABC-type dipeptide/oligopeptide/nickel transport system ATPase subunit